MLARLTINVDALTAICERYRLSRLALFGSVLRDDFTPRSDVDVLIEFQPGADRSLFTLVDLRDELEEMFGRPVHLTTPGSLSAYFRQQVLAEAEDQYVAA